MLDHLNLLHEDGGIQIAGSQVNRQHLLQKNPIFILLFNVFAKQLLRSVNGALRSDRILLLITLLKVSILLRSPRIQH